MKVLAVAVSDGCATAAADRLDHTDRGRVVSVDRQQSAALAEHSDPAITLRHYVRLTTAARAKAVAGLDKVTRTALEAAERRAAADAGPALDNVAALTSRRR